MLIYNIEINYYKILDLTSTATSIEIKKAYHKLALKYHPDKGGDADKFKALAEAYEILMDAETKAKYDCERSIYSLVDEGDTPSYPNSNKSKYHTARATPVSNSTMVFNTATHTNLSSSTSLVERNNTNLIASAGIKAEDMTVNELFNLAMASEYVALALAKNIEQLKRIPRGYSYDAISIWKLALKYSSFAYQILARKETRAFLYQDVYSHNLEKLLKNDYNLLLLIASSEELTKNFLYEYEKPNLTGTQLHKIHDFHLKNHGSCQAFKLLLESNEQLKLLFDNHQILQSTNGRYELSQLELLGYLELKDLALQNQVVAFMVINNSELQNKFQVLQNYLIDILLAYPALLVDFFNNSQRSFYFYTDYSIVSGCKKSHVFLLCILNSLREANSLNGFDIEQIIEHDRNALEHIYKKKELKNRHLNYLAFVEWLTDDPASATKDIDDIIINSFGEIDWYFLLSPIEHLSKKYAHNILAANTQSLIKFYQIDNAYFSYRLAKISLTFFCAIYDQESFPSNCYEYVYEYCNLYFKAFEMLCQDSQALTEIGDDQLYDLQQKWVTTEKSKVKEIFNNNPALMQHWLKGHQIKKLQQSVVVADYEEQPALRNESESLVKTRSLILSLQDYVHFNNITFSKENFSFISWLLEQDWLSNIVSMQSKNRNILSGIFWFLALTNKPQLLNENFPLDFITQQIEIAIDDIKKGKSIEVKWLIKQLENKTTQTLYHLYSVSEQEELWFNYLLENINIQDKDAWIKLLQVTNFSNKVLEREECLEKLAVLNWECPTYQLQELEQDQLINYIIHLIPNYPDPKVRDRIFSTALIRVQDLNRLLLKLSKLDNQKQVDIYLILLQQGQLTLIEFLQNNKNIALLRAFSSLQEYFIAHHNEEKNKLFAMVDSCCIQKLYGDALIIFSLMYQSKLENKIDNRMLNYFEMQPSNNVHHKGLIVIGLAGMLTAISLIVVFNSPSIMLLSALAASMVLVMVGTYQLTVNGGDKMANISYREALSRRNSAMFFKAEPTLQPVENKIKGSQISSGL